MKVLFIIDSLIGYGAEKSLVEIILRFKKINATVVHLYKGDELKGKLENNGVNVYSLNLTQKQSSQDVLRILKSIIQTENPKIIHTTLFRSEIVGRRLKKIYPDILLVGSFVSNSYSKHRYRNLSFLSQIKLLSTQWKDKLSAGKVDFFISNSKAIKFSNAKALGVDKDKIVVIYRGRDVSSLNKKDGSFVLNEIDLQNKKVFLNVARLQKSKGQMDLLRAFKGFNQKHRESILLIVGEGNYRKELEMFIEINSLKKEVYLLGYRKDVSDILSLSDFFIFPSYYEGLPGALIEAILSKTPTIISDIPENRECIPENTALFFEPGNIQGIQKRMEQALQTRDWSKRTYKARDYAILNFNIDNVSKEYEEFYFEKGGSR